MGDYNFSPELACAIGVEESIMVQNLVFWVRHNKANNTNFHEGRYWTYNSVKAFQELFPFWTTKQLRRIMESLYSQNVVLKGQFNKANFDRTGWYTLSDQYLYLLDIIVLPKWANELPQKGKPIPYNKQADNNSTSKDVEALLISDDVYSDFIKQFNEQRKSTKPYKLTEKVKKQIRARIKDKYTVNEIIQALKNAMGSDFHSDNNCNDLTPEFITRPDKLEKYLNYKPKLSTDKKTTIKL